jgi:hypothetical protein
VYIELKSSTLQLPIRAKNLPTESPKPWYVCKKNSRPPLFFLARAPLMTLSPSFREKTLQLPSQIAATHGPGIPAAAAVYRAATASRGRAQGPRHYRRPRRSQGATPLRLQGSAPPCRCCCRVPRRRCCKGPCRCCRGPRRRCCRGPCRSQGSAPPLLLQGAAPFPGVRTVAAAGVHATPRGSRRRCCRGPHRSQGSTPPLLPGSAPSRGPHHHA